MTAAKQAVWDVVALGEALVEFNQTRPGEPQYLQGFGGDTSNAVIAAARAGARTAYLTRMGSDAFGQALLDLWAREGVDTSAVERDAQHPTGIYFVTHGAAGHEFSYLRAGSAASRMAPAWLQDASANGPAAVLQQCRILHVSGISLAVSASACDTAYEAMRVARAAGARVAFDPNLRLKLWPLARARACIAHAVSLCDIFLPGLDDMAALLGLLGGVNLPGQGSIRLLGQELTDQRSSLKLIASEPEIARVPMGRYTYLKDRGKRLGVVCEVHMFEMNDVTLADDYPELGRRERQWVLTSKAAEMVDEPELQEILKSL